MHDFNHLIDVARHCEELGYDSVWLYDHLSPFWSPSGRVFECWTALSAVAARTHQIRVGSLVTNVNLRDPSLLAKMTSTVDNISDGRLIVGLGTGDKLSRKELTSYGYRFASLGERIERLKESIQILKAMWIEEETTFHGKYYRIARAVNFPKPKQRPRPPIWVGGKHPRVLDIVAEEADGWNYWGLTKDVLERRTRYFSDKCTQCGRDPGTVVRSWSGTYQQLSRGATSHSELVDSVAANLRDQTEPGTRYFIASFSSRDQPESYQVFAEAVESLA